MKSIRQIVLGLSVIVVVACGRASDLEGPLKEQRGIGDADTPQTREQLMRLGRTHVAKFEPDCRIEGVAVYPPGGPGWRVIVDCIAGVVRKNVHLDVDLFLKDDGTLYWKTEYVPERSESKPQEFVTEALPR